MEKDHAIGPDRQNELRRLFRPSTAMNRLEFGEDCKGFLIAQDVLSASGTIQFKTDLPVAGLVFDVESDGFCFKLWADDGRLCCHRNAAEVVFPEDVMAFLAREAKQGYVRLRWSPTTVSIAMGLSRQRHAAWTEGVCTPPTLPPTSLIRWARQQDLLPRHDYASEEHLRQRVYSCLEAIQDKVSRMPTVNLFWDILRDKNKITSRSPKAEPDLHSFVAAVLQDETLLSGIEMSMEHRTGVGSLDFMFSGFISGRGMASLCAEAKNAHSTDLFHGLKTQLPSYMKNMGVAYGAYLVFWYKGKWWQKPNRYDTAAILDAELKQWQLDHLGSSPELTGVRVFVLDLSKPSVASSRDALRTDEAKDRGGYRDWVS